MQDYLMSLLLDLAEVEQSPQYHPEGNALYHSLQTFECADQGSQDPILWASALFHDVGKAIDGANHAQIGAELLSGVLHPTIVWLVAHHLALVGPKSARFNAKWHGSPRLIQLRQLRRFDLAGRDPYAQVPNLDTCFARLEPVFDLLIKP